MMDSKSKVSSTQWLVMVLCAAVAALAVSVVVLLRQPATIISTFEECRKAGGTLLESYPEQCSINKTTFTNTAQQAPGAGNEYVGMEESQALDKAKQSDTSARVVEREGEALPVTMDFMFGRHNFYVKDGNVYRVEVEGQATDAN